MIAADTADTAQVVIPESAHRFGPGSLEAVTLFTRGVRLDGHAQVQVRLEGTYRVYCGEGWEHQVDVAWPWSPQASYAPRSDASTDALSFYFAVGHELVEAALADWNDPCVVCED